MLRRNSEIEPFASLMGSDGKRQIWAAEVRVHQSDFDGAEEILKEVVVGMMAVALKGDRLDLLEIVKLLGTTTVSMVSDKSLALRA